MKKNYVYSGDDLWSSLFSEWITSGKPRTIRYANIEYLVNFTENAKEPYFIVTKTYGTTSDHYIDPYYNDSSFG